MDQRFNDDALRPLQLSDDALEAFDVDFRDYDEFLAFLGQQIPSQAAQHLDIGGGNGSFGASLRKDLEMARTVNLDNSKMLLSRNKDDNQHSPVFGSATEMGSALGEQRFDLITINMLLHHLVGKTKEEGDELVVRCLSQAKQHLNPGGSIAVFEQVYEGWTEDFPGSLIYALTSVKFAPMAVVARKLGANTAGVGVRFRSSASWRACFERAGLLEAASSEFVVDKVPIGHRVPLGIRRRSTMSFILQSA